MHRQNSLRVQSAVRGLRILLFNVKTSSSIDGRALGIIYNDVVKFSLLSARNNIKKKKNKLFPAERFDGQVYLSARHRINAANVVFLRHTVLLPLVQDRSRRL